jgi:hypothetical protein
MMTASGTVGLPMPPVDFAASERWIAKHMAEAFGIPPGHFR